MEELHEKQKQKLEIEEELELVKHSLGSETQTLAEVTSDCSKLRLLCEEKDSALQVIIVLVCGDILMFSFLVSAYNLFGKIIS